MSTYGFDENKCKKEVYAKDNFAIMTGSITLTANTPENLDADKWTLTDIQLDYPSGFTADNSVVISFGVIDNNYVGTRGYCFGDITGSKVLSKAVLTGAIPKKVSLNPENISVSIGNYPTEERICNYKIILMKL